MMKINAPVSRSLAFAGLLAAGTSAAAASGTVTSEPFHWYPNGALDWVDDCDDCDSGKISLGFSVNLGGKLFDSFEMDSNGYIELLSGAETPSGYGYGSIDGLTSYQTSDRTYILAAYDDLSSDYYGYQGYALFADRAVFSWATETYDDEDSGLMNVFQVALFDDGSIHWNFLEAGYSAYDYDLFSGLYLGTTKELFEITRDDIPQLASYSFTPVPVPAALWLFGSGLIGMVGVARRSR